MGNDAWMNPPYGMSFQAPKPPPYGTVRYVIERQKQTICFGNPGSITEWRLWSTHETAQERDDAFIRLTTNRNSEAWSLRKRVQVWWGSHWEYRGHWVNED